MTKVKDLNPTIGDVGGTDLGIPFLMPNGKVGYLFGDTFGGAHPAGGVAGGSNWRSPVLLVDSERDVGQPIVFDYAAKNGDQLWPYVHNNGTFSTVLPCDAVTIGTRIYLWVMVTNGLGNERWCEIWYSDDSGETWINGTNSTTKWSTSAFRGQRVMMTWDRGRDGYVYAISTGGLARNKNALIWRVAEADILDPTKWESWSWTGQWQWIMNPTDAQPGDILAAGSKLGEIGLRWIQGHWVFSGFDAAGYRAFVKVGSSITGTNWQTTPTTYPVRGTGFFPVGYDVQVNLYGCYVHPDSKFKNADGTTGKFSMIVSQWNGVNGQGPYRAMQYSIPTPAPTGTVVQNDPQPPGSTGATWDDVITELNG
jgi:hypothetical protein